ncbi:hypothetical protein D9M71_723920 [compost metagenome]
MITTRFQQNRDLGIALSRINVRFKISRLTRHGIQQQILSNNIFRCRDLKCLWLIGIHCLIHSLDIVHDRDGFTDLWN